jgi:DNA repair exonuclease SbcCD ATPase subunit
LNELYNIFAKELLLMVLQDSLPVLNDIINNYLTQVVDYQIKFALEKTSSDKLELAATIIDEKGEREIKSLSGGQMIILKLVRMLSISSYIHSPILFLDETINNLDAETVGKVADMLEDFVQSRDMKLYTVTHSQQIQDMDIWDEVVEIL